MIKLSMKIFLTCILRSSYFLFVPTNRTLPLCMLLQDMAGLHTKEVLCSMQIRW
jgi:hypothetical protein